MEATAMKKSINADRERNSKQKKASIYQTVWRWHFYAGIIFAPFLIILAFSGSVYLFKPQIESMLYHNLYYVQEKGSSTLSPLAQVAKVKEAYPNGEITSIKYYDSPSRTTEIGVMDKGKMLSFYVNPYNGDIYGSLDNDKKFTEIFKKLHSQLIIGGTIANRIVELAACWAVLLLITGLYIWWPRNKATIWGIILPRFKKKGRIFWRDLHAVPAFWLSIFILILIATGLPWSGVMGEGINRLATSTNTGYPPFAFSWGEKPESKILTKDIAEDVPWAAENLPVPASKTNGYMPLSLEDVTYIAQSENMKKPYTISMPQGEKGVYTVSASDTKPSESATMHIDQYSGAVLSNVTYNQYGVLAKMITVGIALHEGRLFGLANQIIGLIVCLGLIGIVISSFIMWRKRKPNGKFGSPSRANDPKVMRTIFFMMLAMGVIMPLVGISIILVYLLDRFIFMKIKPIKAWLG
ncbi:PepSY-associated TM helix domain-containing protein [Heyndrickxia sp. NPDC080065]|uniref:PepSY-associated TM helix domain-containing protein n=1 Tax=Heyndrickxia sp. NPDC080065 TaxID=3390568 RepID=UPI003CFF9BCE